MACSSARVSTIVFASPRHLHLRLLCTDKSPVKEALDVWPELPIAIRVLYYGRLRPRTQPLVTNVIAALEQHDRVCEIRLEGGPNLLSYDARELSGRPVSAYPWERKQG